MATVILTSPTKNGVLTDMKGVARGKIAFNPVQKNSKGDDELAPRFHMRGKSHPGPKGIVTVPDVKSVVDIATYQTPYRTKDATKTTPAKFSPFTFIYMQMSKDSFEDLLRAASAQGRIGNMTIAYATGVSPEIGNGDGTWGVDPQTNGVQLTF